MPIIDSLNCFGIKILFFLLYGFFDLDGGMESPGKGVLTMGGWVGVINTLDSMDFISCGRRGCQTRDFEQVEELLNQAPGYQC